MSNVIPFERLVQARLDKALSEYSVTMQALLDTFIHEPSAKELAQHRLFYALLAHVVDHEGFLTPQWLNALLFTTHHQLIHPEIAPFESVALFKSRIKGILDGGEKAIPIMEIKAYPVDEVDLVLSEEQALKNIEQLEIARDQYTKQTGKLVWGPGVFFFKAWYYLLNHCTVQVTQKDDVLTVRAKHPTLAGVVEAYFHLNAVYEDWTTIRKSLED